MPKLKMNSLSLEGNIKQEFEAEFINENEVIFKDEDNQYTLLIEKEKIVYEVRGGINTDLTFERGKTHHGEYETPYGMIEMDVKTSLLFVKIEEDIKIVIHYNLIIDNTENFHSKEIYIERR